MSDISIRAEKLSKKYKIGATRGPRWLGPRRVLAEDFAQLLKRNSSKGQKTTFWALKDISFEISQGGLVGIIGRNGAGKTTLLKLLSRITEPTSGRAEIYGRVGSLLEVGTGFHSELTGRENIFISGAILGMTRSEIKQKFDEIVAFSGVEKFLETPVKRFSSGMEVRLAFSVAAHLNPEVLLVDEVLSIGDAAFRKKSLNKIHEVSQKGGTVLFVSHNMATVASLCDKAMVLDRGKLSLPVSPVTEAISHYIGLIQKGLSEQLEEGRQGRQPGMVKVTSFSVQNGGGQHVEALTNSSPLALTIEYEVVKKALEGQINMSILFKTLDGNIIASLDSRMAKKDLALTEGKGMAVCKIEKLPLLPGNVSISLILRLDDQVVDVIEDVFVGPVEANIEPDPVAGIDTSGWVSFEHEWST